MRTDATFGFGFSNCIKSEVHVTCLNLGEIEGSAPNVNYELRMEGIIYSFWSTNSGYGLGIINKHPYGMINGIGFSLAV